MSNHHVIAPRSLDLHDGETMINWTAQDDMAYALERGAKETGIDLPAKAAGGHVLISLDVDGDGTITSIVTGGNAAFGESGINEAIEALKALRTALAKISQCNHV